MKRRFQSIRFQILDFLENFSFSNIYSECTVGNNYQFTAGDGTTQGSCKAGEYCQADGTCTGRLGLLIVIVLVSKKIKMS